MKLGGGVVASGVQKKRKGVTTAGKISLLEEDDEGESDDYFDGVNRSIDSKFDNETTQQTKNDFRNKKMKTSHVETSATDSSTRSQERSLKNNDEVGKPKSDKINGNNDLRKDHWLYRNIVVRIISKKLANGDYYKRKAIVDRVIDKYEAEVEVMESSQKAKDGGDILRLDQDDLETVIPKELGEVVRILNGRYRGEKATVEKLDKTQYRAELRLLDDGGIVVLDYEDFSKIAR